MEFKKRTNEMKSNVEVRATEDAGAGDCVVHPGRVEVFSSESEEIAKEQANCNPKYSYWLQSR